MRLAHSIGVRRESGGATSPQHIFTQQQRLYKRSNLLLRTIITTQVLQRSLLLKSQYELRRCVDFSFAALNLHTKIPYPRLSSAPPHFPAPKTIAAAFPPDPSYPFPYAILIRYVYVYEPAVGPSLLRSDSGPSAPSLSVITLRKAC